MPPGITDANFTALQQQLSGIQVPRQERTSLQESIIDAIPLAMSAFADDDGRTTSVVASILDRRKRADALAFENELDLRRLQLDAALKGIQNERDKVESTYRNSLLQAQTAGVVQETEESRLKAPLERDEISARINVNKLNLEQSKESFPLEQTKRREDIKTLRLNRQLAEDEAELKEAQFALQSDVIREDLATSKQKRSAAELETSELKRRFEAVDRLKDSPDPVDQQIYKSVTLTGKMPDASDGPENRLKAIAKLNPRAAILVEKVTSNNSTPEDEDELQTLMENAENPNTAAIFEITNPIISKYHALKRVKANINVGTGKLYEVPSNELINTTVNKWAPYYKDVLDLGLGNTIKQELKDVIDKSTTKMTAIQLESLIAKEALNYTPDQKQKLFLQEQLKDILEVEPVPDDPTLSQKLRGMKDITIGTLGSIHKTIRAAQEAQKPKPKPKKREPEPVPDNLTAREAILEVMKRRDQEKANAARTK